MLCEKCKIREANIQYSEYKGGVHTEHHYCAYCAKDMEEYSYMFEGDFPLAKLLSGILGEIERNSRSEGARSIVCPNCNTAYDEFVKDSKFGCKECYEVFGLLIADNIKQLQGSDVHKGKKPKYMNAKSRVVHIESSSEIDELRRRLSLAIEAEEYELAAEYRDKIKELEEVKDE